MPLDPMTPDNQNSARGPIIHGLSQRLRPNIECAPWVIEEVKALERALASRADAPPTQNAEAWQLLHDIRDGKVNPEDEADKFLREFPAPDAPPRGEVEGLCVGCNHNAHASGCCSKGCECIFHYERRLPASPPPALPVAETVLSEEEIEAAVNARINTPEIQNFIEGVKLESLHQQQRWGTEGDSGKSPEDWLWLVAFLATKATQAARYNDQEKYLHHIITAAAVLLNWHGFASGKDSGFNPGAPNPDENPKPREMTHPAPALSEGLTASEREALHRAEACEDGSFWRVLASLVRRLSPAAPLEGEG